MKKTYIAPELAVVKIQTPCLLAGSDKTMSVSNEEETSGWADGRESDFDFDE